MAPLHQYFSALWIVVVATAKQHGECSEPLLMTAIDHSTQQVVEIGMPALRQINGPPYPTAPDCLLITIDGTAVAGVHLSLGWPPPARVIDLMVEFRKMTNGNTAPVVGGLGGALLWFGLSTTGAIGATTSPRQLRRRLDAASALFKTMLPLLVLNHALFRGRYLVAVAKVEANGVPVNSETVQQLRIGWPLIRDHVIRNIGQNFSFYSGRRFDLEAFTRWVAQRAIPWPRLASGQLDLGNDAFKEMARIYPVLGPIKELRTTLTGFDPAMLAIGKRWS